MNREIVSSLIVNASLLLSISLIYSTLFNSRWKKNVLTNILSGLIIGMVGMFLMMNSVTPSPGTIFDTRSILISAVGLFFGFIPTIIAAVIICVYRMILGGSGALAGVLVTLFTAGIGLVWNRFRLQNILSKKKAWLEFYLFGFAAHVIMLACMLALPRDSIAGVLQKITLPVIVLFPFVSMVLCMVLFYHLENNKTEKALKNSELRFRTMFEQVPIGIVIQETKKTLYYNDMYEKILGRTQSEIAAQGWETFTHPDDLKEDLDKLKALWAGDIKDYSMIKRYFKPDGEIVWVNMTVVSLNIDNQASGHYLCMIQDITHLKKSEDDLKTSEENYKKLYHEFLDKQVFLKSLINTIPDHIFFKDLNGIYIEFNKSFQERYGLDADKIVGFTDYDLFNKDTADHINQIDSKMFAEKKEQIDEEFVIYPDGKHAYLETVISPYIDSAGNLAGLIGTSRDITERKHREEEIVYLNHHDVLTGLYNRTFFDNEVIRIDTPDHLPLSVIIGDINGLKFVNDAFGHAKGDILLVEMAKILCSCCRKEDVVARTGGDEFCILLPRTDSNAAQVIIDKIRKTCEEYASQTEKEAYYMSISLGYASKTNSAELFGDIQTIAEEYMYRHKLLEHKSLHSAIISSIKTTMFEKSNETEEHAERMAEMSKKFGRAMDFSDDDLVSLELVTTLHDIGKISIDQRILDKPGKLTDEEWTQIKKHPDVGYRIALTVPELSRIAEYILCHHERWDGKGYPQGLRGEEIPLISRMLTVVDAYDAMTQDRSYRKAMPKGDAIIELEKNAGTQFDPEITAIFIGKVLANEE